MCSTSSIATRPSRSAASTRTAQSSTWFDRPRPPPPTTRRSENITPQCATPPASNLAAFLFTHSRDISNLGTTCRQTPPTHCSTTIAKLDRWTIELADHTQQERFLKANESSPKYRVPGLLLRYCGVRPVELEKGIRAELIGDEVLIEVNGGKVRSTAGQPWRKFRLHAAVLPDWFLLELAEKGGKLYSAKPDSLRAHLARISAAVFPARDSEGNLDVLLSAYVFRHGLVSDMRAEKWDTADIAAVIG